MIRAKKSCLIYLVLLLLIPFSVSAEELEFHLEYQTIFSAFERENDKGESQQVLPIYEYMQIDYGYLESEGLSLHLHGWLIYWFNHRAAYVLF